MHNIAVGNKFQLTVIGGEGSPVSCMLLYEDLSFVMLKNFVMRVWREDRITMQVLVISLSTELLEGPGMETRTPEAPRAGECSASLEWHGS